MKLLTVIALLVYVLIVCSAATVTNSTTTPKSVTMTVDSTGGRVQIALPKLEIPIAKKSTEITVKTAAQSTNIIGKCITRVVI